MINSFQETRACLQSALLRISELEDKLKNASKLSAANEEAGPLASASREREIEEVSSPEHVQSDSHNGLDSAGLDSAQLATVGAAAACLQSPENRPNHLEARETDPPVSSKLPLIARSEICFGSL